MVTPMFSAPEFDFKSLGRKFEGPEDSENTANTENKTSESQVLNTTDSDSLSDPTTTNFEDSRLVSTSH